MSAASAKESAVRQGTLLYFNQVLLEKRLISECEYRRMKWKIQHPEQGQQN